VHLLFDLDGTLVDSLPAISVSVNRTLEELGVPVPAHGRLGALVGAPLAEVFRAVLGPSHEDLLEPAIARYRILFDEVGMLHIKAFPEIDVALARFDASGHTLQVVTARSAPSADLILRGLDLRRYFVGVHAPEPSARAYDKADYVRSAMDAVGALPADTVMVGDRADDVRAALAHGVRAVGVEWGNGTTSELEAAGAHFVATHVGELVSWVEAYPNGSA
jgi:phosphoglycolate phosphatase